CLDQRPPVTGFSSWTEESLIHEITSLVPGYPFRNFGVGEKVLYGFFQIRPVRLDENGISEMVWVRVWPGLVACRQDTQLFLGLEPRTPVRRRVIIVALQESTTENRADEVGGMLHIDWGWHD